MESGELRELGVEDSVWTRGAHTEVRPSPSIW